MKILLVVPVYNEETKQRPKFTLKSKKEFYNAKS